MIYQDVDLNNDSLEDIQEMELGDIAINLLRFAESIDTHVVDGRTVPKLCSIDGQLILAEYQFKGNYDQVVEQLNILSLELEVEFTEANRNEVIKRKTRLFEYIHSIQGADDMKEINMALKDGDVAKHYDLIEQRQFLKDTLHDTGMCSCFNNF